MKMFKVSQKVSYGPQGVFEISEIADKNLTGKTQKYYILRSVKGNGSVVYVPVDNEKLVARMRPVLSSQEVYDLIKDMPEEEFDWIESDEERKSVFRNIIAECEPKRLAYLIKSVYLHQRELFLQGKKLYSSDERYFKEAERILYDEFSIVLDIAPDLVPRFIITQMGNNGDD